MQYLSGDYWRLLTDEIRKMYMGETKILWSVVSGRKIVDFSEKKNRIKDYAKSTIFILANNVPDKSGKASFVMNEALRHGYIGMLLYS